MKYSVYSENGWSCDSKFHTIIGAKRAATYFLAYGCGDIYVGDDDGALFVRRFWQNFNRFGWGKWENV